MLHLINKITPAGLKKRVNVFLHQGDKYFCPFCHYSSKNLAPIGLDIPVNREKQIIGGGRRLGGCYQCGSTDRERLIYAYLKEKLLLFDADKNKSILHIAPEKQLSRVLLNFNFRQYICGDLFTPGYSYPPHVQNMNVLDIPYPDDTFDLVLCNHVLEHVPPDLEAMQELRRVLKKEGQAILQVPISKNTAKTFEDFSISDPQQREIIFGQKDHIRIYGQDYPQRLEQAGFKVARLNLFNEFSRYGINPDEDLFIGTK
ncbi:class I SAM-dependent methyltransferase [Adhaeribacter swui]|uniref:Class I SAM-dependent methyltransferase n=1 Tax=Adhaeribacter swui TaxID=2086471 RepID=A0A7G7GEQ1_9BACT|nr:class I SAM-dependent methyltransferase [Adhaeribacter swui]QNF35635.1 class I SAM-dependent methyltransferase [Adhaeribacter swui]